MRGVITALLAVAALSLADVPRLEVLWPPNDALLVALKEQPLVLEFRVHGVRYPGDALVEVVDRSSRSETNKLLIDTADHVYLSGFGVGSHVLQLLLLANDAAGSVLDSVVLNWEILPPPATSWMNRSFVDLMLSKSPATLAQRAAAAGPHPRRSVLDDVYAEESRLLSPVHTAMIGETAVYDGMKVYAMDLFRPMKVRRARKLRDTVARWGG